MSDPFVVVTTVLVCLANLGILLACYRHLSRFGAASAFLGLIVFATWATEYALRPIGVMAEGEFGREAGFLRYLQEVSPGALTDANLVSLASTGAFAIGLVVSFHGGSRKPATSRPGLAPRAVISVRPRQRASLTRRLRLPVAPLLALAVFASAVVALRLGTLGGALNGEFGRLNSNGLLYLLVNMVGLVLLVALVSMQPDVMARRSSRRALVASYLVFVAIHLLVLGGRAEIIIVTIAAVMIMTERFGRPRRRTLMIGLVGATLLLGVQRVATREALAPENRQTSRITLALRSLTDPLALVTRYDVSAYDKLVLLEEADPSLAGGTTYLAAVGVPAPGSTVQGPEGGNRAFTRLFIPARYERDVTFEGISMLGEARYNFGWIGPPLVAALAGGLLGGLLRRSRRSGKWQLTSALVVGLFPSLVRADAVNTAALGGSLVILTLTLLALATRSSLLQHRYLNPAPVPSYAHSIGDQT